MIYISACDGSQGNRADSQEVWYQGAVRITGISAPEALYVFDFSILYSELPYFQ